MASCSRATVNLDIPETDVTDFRCDAGFFGEPQRPGGSCQPCDCNDNNNLTDSRACHPITGDCYLCERNTDGRHCEYCAQWYHGDAVAAKNCTACTCDQCGSSMCDNQVGDCHCKPNVEGLNCDRCISDHWGFSRCGGCYPCHCGIASSSTQCDDETGQCQCRPGAVGLRCEHCEHGFWNYGEYGCQNATARQTSPWVRCVMCVRDSVIVKKEPPELAATNVYSHISEFPLMDADDIANLLSGEQYNNFIGDARAVLANMSQLVNSLKRSNTVADNDVERAMNLTDSAGEVIQDIRRRAADASASVDHAKNLVASLGSHSSALIIDPRWVEYAEETLHQLEAATALSEKVADYLSDSQKMLKESRKKSEEARKTASGVSTLRLGVAWQRPTDGRDKAIEEHGVVSGVLLEVKNLTEQAKDALESVGNSLTNLAEVRAELAEMVEPKREKRQASYDKGAVDARVRDLEIEASRLKNNFGSAQLESQNAVEAATAYSNLTDSLKNAQEKAQWAIDEMTELSEGLQEKGKLHKSSSSGSTSSYQKSYFLLLLKIIIDFQKEQVKQALNGSATLVRQASNLQQNTLNTLKKEAVETENRIDRLTTMVDGMRRNVDGIRASLVSPLNETTFAEVEKSADHVNSLLVDSDKVLSTARESLAELKEATDKAVSEATDALQGIKTTRSNDERSANATDYSENRAKELTRSEARHVNLLTLSVLVPKLMKSYDNMHNSATNRTAKVEACVDKIAALKEQIAVARDAVARDAANRIKLGAHFEQGSSLDLAMPHRVARSAAHTDISFHFRTAKEHGIPLFFGNEEGSAGTRAVPTDDYIAVEIEYGLPKVTINLGEKPLVIRLYTRVADNQWRQLSVERIGRSATVKLYKPNSDEIADEVRNRDFEGDIEDLTLHGEPVGLWNAKSGGAVAVRGAVPRPRPRTKESSAQQGVSLDGEGYIVYQMGYWIPENRDFLALELSDGNVKLSLDFGSGAAQWLADTVTYNDGQWHTVMVARDERHLIVQAVPHRASVDWHQSVRLGTDEMDLYASHASKGVRNACPLGTVNTVEHWLIGKDSFDFQVAGEMAKILFGRHDSASFVGCVGDVSYNGELLDFAKAPANLAITTTTAMTTTIAPTSIFSVLRSNLDDMGAQRTIALMFPSAIFIFSLLLTVLVLWDWILGLQKMKWTEPRFGLQPNSRLEYEVMPDIIRYRTIIHSNRSILNGEWHSVKASRRGSEGLLVVDEESAEAVVSAGTRRHRHGSHSLPLGASYYGMASYARTIVPVGQSFSAEMEVRPRTKNGVLFSVGVVEYLTVQILDGTVKFIVDSGSGAESLIYTPPTSNTICDGHWHSIKVSAH
ncbi:laminin G domain protein [Ostertagia ostertagi]